MLSSHAAGLMSPTGEAAARWRSAFTPCSAGKRDQAEPVELVQKNQFFCLSLLIFPLPILFQPLFVVCFLLTLFPGSFAFQELLSFDIAPHPFLPISTFSPGFKFSTLFFRPLSEKPSFFSLLAESDKIVLFLADLYYMPFSHRV